jgi:isohexenylglutaconyl-CoA hydratase
MTTSANDPHVLTRRDGSVLHVTLNQPAARNAMSLQMVNELLSSLRSAEADPGVRVLVLRGAGGHFCSGGDLKDMAAARSKPPGDGLDPLVAVSAAFGEVCAAYARTPLATVAVLEGSVMGGGFGLACAVDIALASETVQFRLPETSRGVVPAQIAPFLVERLGYSEAKRLAVSGASLDARQALQLRLVHEVVETSALDAALGRVLHDVLQGAPRAIAATKALLMLARMTTPDQLIDRAAEVFAAAARGPEGAEGMIAFVQKRRPAWAPAESE